MPSENYDFVPWDSHDNIHEFFNSDDIDKAFFAPLLARLATSKVGQAVASQGVKGALKTGAKNLSTKVGTGLKNLKAKVGVKGGGAVTEAAGKTAAEGATSAAKTAAKGASEAVESVAPKPKLGEKMPSAEVTTPEPPAAEPAAEMPEPEEPSGSAGNKTDFKKVGMQLAQQSQANAAQKKQAQEQRAMDMARRGASVQTGEPMENAWSTLLKGRELKDFVQQYPDIKFQTQEVFDSPLTDIPLDYGVSTHGSTSHLNPVGDNARSRTMNPQRMDILQRFLDRSKAKPKIIQQVHGNVENPYYVPPGMKSPPLEFENSNPNFENEDFYVGLDAEGPITEEMIDEHRRRYNIKTGEPMEIVFQLLKQMQAYDPEHPVELKSVASSPYINEACTLCSNPNALISLRYANPTFTKDYTHHMCYECAKQYDVHDMIHPAALSPSDYDVKLAGKPMEIAFQLLKRQTTLSAFDERQIRESIKPQNSNIFIAAKPGLDEEGLPLESHQMPSKRELSQLSDNMLAEIAALKQKHGYFGITSATGNAAWDLEPSFMLTNVPQSARNEINKIAEKYRQQSIAVSEKEQEGVDFVTPQGVIGDRFTGMAFEKDPMYSTDFPTGQRLTFNY